jgi:hypothetical protein
MVERPRSYDRHRQRTADWRPYEVQDHCGRRTTLLGPASPTDRPLFCWAIYKISSSMIGPSFPMFSSRPATEATRFSVTLRCLPKRMKIVKLASVTAARTHSLTTSVAPYHSMRNVALACAWWFAILCVSGGLSELTRTVSVLLQFSRSEA